MNQLFYSAEVLTQAPPLTQTLPPCKICPFSDNSGLPRDVVHKRNQHYAVFVEASLALKELRAVGAISEDVWVRLVDFEAELLMASLRTDTK